MYTVSNNPVASVRMLETWLPLAQSENIAQGWGYTPQALEQLVVRAVPTLQQTHTAQQARFALWLVHWQTSVVERRKGHDRATKRWSQA